MEQRIQAPFQTDDATYRVDDLLVDVSRQRVTRGEIEIPLSGLSFELFVALVRDAPRLLSPHELMDRVWPGMVVGPETVSQRVKLVREALGDDANTPRYIAGVRGRGYRMVAAVTRVPKIEVPATGPDVVSLEETELESPPTSKRARILWLGGMAVVLIAAAAAWVWIGGTDPERTSVVVSAPPRTLAVLPFTNLSGDASQEYFSDGLTEELINRMAKIPDLRVTARTSAFSFKGKQQDVRSIAEALGVAAVLEGSVRRSGDRVRVTAQLIDARDGYDLWSDSYERNVEDAFAIHNEIANRIAQVIGIQLTPDAPRQPTTNPAAYDLYLRGRTAIAQRLGEAHIRQAIDSYERALALDPAFVHAKAGLASALLLLPAYADVPAFEIRTRAQQLAMEALAIDDTISDAHAVLAGYYSEVQPDFVRAEMEHQAALRYAPNSANNHQWHGDFLLSMGRFREGVAELTEAYRLDPASPGASYYLSLAHVFAGDAENAERYASIAKQLGRKDTAVLFGDAAVLRGQLDQALIYYREHENGPWRFEDQLIPLLRDPDRYRPELARTWLQDCEDGFGKGCYFRMVLVQEYDVAFATARRGFKELWWHPQYLWDPMLAGARSQPGFKDLARDVGLVDYWRKYGWADACEPMGEDFRCE